MKLRHTITKLIAVTFFALLLSGIPTPLAQVPVGHAQTNDPGVKSATNDPGVSNANFKIGVKFNNPLKVNTIQDAIKLFVNAIVRLAIPVIVIFFLWSGLSFIFARGNPEKITKARNMFFYTVIGTLLILGAWTITNAIIGTVNSITS